MTADTASLPHEDSAAFHSTKRRVRREHVYRTLWRWHFYAGLIVAPVLIWAAATGALYIFVDEVEPWLYRQMLFVEAGTERVSLQDQLALVRQEFPGSHVDSVAVRKDPARTTEFFLHAESTPAQLVYVDPYRGTVTGSRFYQEGFFPIVRTLHRNMSLGAAGRIVMECGTCWGIILIVTGLALWWPGFRKGRRQGWKGVWWPRLHSGTRLALRDLHAVGGAILAPVMGIIMVTGLFYTMFWGRVFLLTMFVTGGAPPLFVMPLQFEHASGASPLTLDEVLRIALRQDADSDPVSISLPRDAQGMFQVHLGSAHAPLHKVMYAVDQYSGATSLRTDRKNASIMAMIVSFAYPLHVGSIWGLPTKFLALLACLMIILLCVTGVWMWWRARPRGELGIPGRSDLSQLRRWPVLLMGLCGLLMPMAGLTLVLVLLGDWCLQRLCGSSSSPASGVR